MYCENRCRKPGRYTLSMFLLPDYVRYLHATCHIRLPRREWSCRYIM